MKQTAVEWLQEELKGVYESEYFNLKIKKALEMEKEQIKDAIKLAKEMEKEQMSLCYKVGVIDGNNGETLNFENYYNKTFKQ